VGLSSTSLLLENPPEGYPVVRGHRRTMNFKHIRQRRHSSQYHTLPLRDIGLDRLLQGRRIAVHQRLVLVDRDMHRHVTERELLIGLDAKIDAQEYVCPGPNVDLPFAHAHVSKHGSTHTAGTCF
jgi:hypothetical protein